MRIGLISDTHGLLRPQAVQALRGADRIVHAGDVGKPAVLEELAALAPVVAVRGNNDRGDWAEALPHDAVVDAEGVRIYVLHDLGELALDPAAAGYGAVVAGHSHKPSVTERGGVVYVNPGSAGPRRFRLPISVGVLEVARGELQARIELLEV